VPLCAARYGVFPLALPIKPMAAACSPSPRSIRSGSSIPNRRRCCSPEPDRDPPGRAHRPHVRIFRGPGSAAQGELELPLECSTQANARRLLVSLAALLRREDPDLLVVPWGDTWALPMLLDLAEQWGLPLPLNRDPEQAVERRKELSYHAYGQIVCGGRCICSGAGVDPRMPCCTANTALRRFEAARLTGLGCRARRKSPGAGISAMQLITALLMAR
jgi:hypothetical protein